MVRLETEAEKAQEAEFMTAVTSLHLAGHAMLHMEEIRDEILRSRIATTDRFMRRLLLKTGVKLGHVLLDDREMASTRDRLVAAKELEGMSEPPLLALEYDHPTRQYVTLPENVPAPTEIV